MKSVFRSILKILGWQKLLGMAWETIHPDLEKYVQSTSNSFDDAALKVIDSIVSSIVDGEFEELKKA